MTIDGITATHELSGHCIETRTDPGEEFMTGATRTAAMLYCRYDIKDSNHLKTFRLFENILGNLLCM